jgi:hypothetical protein
MSLLALFLVATQAGTWTVVPAAVTVGDTVVITRRVVAEPGVVPQAASLQPNALLEPLNVPVVAYSEGAVVVQYEVALFEPGHHGLAMPAIELVYSDGGVVNVHGDTAWITVLSVLPEEEDAHSPRPSLGPVARTRTEPAMVVLPMATVLLVMGLWGVSRRRARSRPLRRDGSGKRVEAPVVQWARAGELRAVVSAVTDRLRESVETALPLAGRQLSTEECLGVIEENQPDWPTREIESVLRSLDRARFAPAVPSDIVQLAQRAGELSVSLRRSAAGESEH